MRERVVFIFAAASFWSWVVLGADFWLSRGDLISGSHAVGRDFVIIWTAAQMLGEGLTLQVFDPGTFMAAAHRLFDERLSFHFWSYPPTALLNVAWMRGVPYLPAYAIWSAGGLAILAATGRAFLGPGKWILLLVFSPAAAVNVAGGQNGFITASLMLAGFAFPAGAGVAFGLLGFKPQLGLALPFCMIAARRWRTVLIAAIVGLGTATLAALIFGPDSWVVFLTHTVPAQSAMMIGTGPFRLMTPSAFMSGLILTNSQIGALLAQAPFSILGAALAVRAFRRPAEPLLQAGAAFVATFLISPQSFNYDMVPVAAAAVVMVRHPGARPIDMILAACAWISPIAVVPFNAIGIPAMPIFLAALGFAFDHMITNSALAAVSRGPRRRFLIYPIAADE